MNDDERRISETLAKVAAKRGYQAEATTARTPLDDLLEMDSPEDLARDGFAANGEEMNAHRADVFGAALDFYFADGPHPGSVLRRVFALAKAIRPKLIWDMNVREVGHLFDETGAAVSWRVKKIFADYQRLRGAKGFKAPFQKSEKACAAMSRAQHGNTNRRGKKRGPDWRKQKAA